MLKAGMPFPEFSLPDQDGSPVTLDDLKGGRTLVFFYPKDDTPGCTVEACALNENLPNFAGASVYGVSPDSPKSHKEFATKYGLGYTLIADEDHTLAEACGVWLGERNRRSTFMVDENGVVLHVWEDVTPKDHAGEILHWISEGV